MKRQHLPLYLRVVLGVALGTAVGLVAGRGNVILGVTTEDLGKLGMLVIRLLKMLAVPLVLFAVLDAVIRTRVAARQGTRLLVICACNVSIAFSIGLALMNTLRPGAAWRDNVQELAGLSHEQIRKAPEGTSLSPIDNVQRWIPDSLAAPFADNNVIAVVLLAVLAGAAIRRVRRQALESVDTGGSASGDNADPSPSELGRAITAVTDGIAGGYLVLMVMLGWVVEIVPFAVFGVVAQVVGKAGLDTFGALSGFLGIILLGFAIHALGYYTLVAWLVGKVPPRVLYRNGATAILTGLSMNSSLATMPVTLRALESMGVSSVSARLSACIGTNFNNDGITLYEAMAAIFLAQALGYDLSLGAQLTIVAASLMAGIGVAGVPEAGLIVLPLVLSAAGLPEPVVAAMLPLLFSVDWILARARSAVNVMADMVVAILLDRWAHFARDEPAA